MFHRLMLSLGLTLAIAQTTTAAASPIYDKPISIQTVPPKSASDPSGQLRCTFYPDMIIRETDTDEPGSGPTAIIPGSFPLSASSCAQPSSAQQAIPKSAGYAFMGRKGAYLLLAYDDPNGADPFMVIAAPPGRVLYSDAFNGDDVESLTLQNGDLNLKFIRCINGSCSLVQDGASRWTKFIQAGSLPAVFAKAPRRRFKLALRITRPPA